MDTLLRSNSTLWYKNRHISVPGTFDCWGRRFGILADSPGQKYQLKKSLWKRVICTSLEWTEIPGLKFFHPFLSLLKRKCALEGAKWEDTAKPSCCFISCCQCHHVVEASNPNQLAPVDRVYGEIRGVWKFLIPGRLLDWVHTVSWWLQEQFKWLGAAPSGNTLRATHWEWCAEAGTH